MPPNEALERAWATDDADGVIRALRAGANPNTNIDGMPLIMYATGNGHVEMVNELLCNGAEVDARRFPGGETALMFAVSFGSGEHQQEIRDALLKHGAHVNVRDNKGNSVVDLAIAAERLSDAETLLRRGAQCSKAATIELERLRATSHSKGL